ncbi:MAG: PilW family protein [Marinobacter sp.]
MTFQRQAGLSIVELMVALVLATLLTVGLFQIFNSNNLSFRITEATARTQEYGRIASEILGREIRGAGYFGCNIENVVNNLDDTDEEFDVDAHEFDIDAPISSRNAERPAGAVAGTHFIRFSGMENNGNEISTTGPETSASLQVNERGGLEVDDIIAISDCTGTDIFQISNIQQGGGGGAEITLVANSGEDDPGNDFTDNGCTNCLSNNYGTGAQILRPYNRTLYVGTSNVTGERALMRLVPNQAPVELVEGVFDMRVRMGTSNTANNPVNNWTESTGAVNWDNVRAVEVSLLVRGGDNNLFDGAQSLCFPSWADCAGGPNFPAPDNRLYRVYTFTMNVRNASR